MRDKIRKTTPQALPPDQEILNIDGAAALLGVSVKTFSKVLREGDVPGRKVGREWKFSRQALIDWIGSARSRAFLDVGDNAAADDESPPPLVRRRPRVSAARRPPDDGFSVDHL